MLRNLMLRPEEHALRLTLPATSANLGPGFDAAALALSLYLHIEARLAPEFRIEASGRDASVCGDTESSLILATYREVLAAEGIAPPPLHLDLHNEIPLGMGFGSSAAALLAGVALADHFGALDFGDAAIIAAASHREGHPDNVAACWCGGFTVSSAEGGRVATATFAGNPAWRFLGVMQPSALATAEARGLLPAEYDRADAVFNLQRTALLVAAFAQQRLDLLRPAMADRLHQPYRMGVCPLLERLLPLAGEPGFAGVALSGAGPSVLVALGERADLAAATHHVQATAGDEATVIPVRIAGPALRELLAPA